MFRRHSTPAGFAHVRRLALLARGRGGAYLFSSFMLAACLPHVLQSVGRAQDAKAAAAPAPARAQGAGLRLSVMREAAPGRYEAAAVLDTLLRNHTDAEGKAANSASGKLVIDVPPRGKWFLQVENLTGRDFYFRLYHKVGGYFAELNFLTFGADGPDKGQVELDEGQGYALPAGRVYRTGVIESEEGLSEEPLILLGSTSPIRFNVLWLAGGAVRDPAAEERKRARMSEANISSFFGVAGYYDIAVELYEGLLAAAKDNQELSSRLRNALGLAYHSASRYDEALKQYEAALASVRGRNDRGGEAVVLSNLALVYSTLGRNAQAIEMYRRALALEGEMRVPAREAVTLTNLALAYLASGQTEQAVEHYERALALQRRLNNQTGVGKALSGLGSAQRVLCRQALEGAAARQPAAGANAKTAAAPPPCRRVVELHGQALEIARAVGNRNDEGFAFNNLGAAHAALGEHASAVNHYQQALAIYREVGNRAAEGLALNNLMLSWRALEQPRLAALSGKQAVNLYQQMRGEMQGLEAASRQSFIESKSGTYRALADLLIEQGRLPEAQQVIRMLKEEEYFEFVRRDEGEAAGLSARAAISPEEAELERRYREIAGRLVAAGRERGALRDKGELSAAEEQRLAQLEADIELAGRAFQQFLDQLSRERRAAGATDERLFELREAQGLMETLRELGHGAVALYTVVGADKYRVILITPDVQKAAEYPVGAAELNSKIAALRWAVQNPRLDPRPLAQELYKILIGPIAKDLEAARAETLMWSLDGALRYVPLAALHDGERYLVERYRTTVFTPASRDRLKDQPGERWRGLGFGVSKAHAGFRPLAAVPGELRAVISDEAGAAGQGGGALPGRVLLDEAFTADAMRAALRSRYPVVHIASHFAFRPGDEADSFLLLGDGGRLSLAQLKATTNLFGGVELLTLSACNTATGGEGADGREVEGFAVLAQRQGAKAVLATLWPVADESTNRLMRQFYRARGERPGTPKVEALRQAQLSLLRGDLPATPQAAPHKSPPVSLGPAPPAAFKPDPRAPHAHPYFWAPFILIGNWR